MVRPQVALAARVGSSGLLFREAMPRMACRTASFAAVRVDASYAGVRPGRGIKFAFASTLTLEPWHCLQPALTAAGPPTTVRGNCLRSSECPRPWHDEMAAADRTVLCGSGNSPSADNGCNPEPPVIVTAGIAGSLVRLLLSLVAVIAVHACLPHLSQPPHLMETGCLQFMAFDADLPSGAPYSFGSTFTAASAG